MMRGVLFIRTQLGSNIDNAELLDVVHRDELEGTESRESSAIWHAQLNFAEAAAVLHVCASAHHTVHNELLRLRDDT